ncbi:hypothetical protein MGSAQ_000798 [marine sediment metagenome]|uniref:Uncharacterized protein n=1 Tax=marine sediment metagenome TaxID=412755 RepID=A0A1B6NY41_9ZZZZ
MSVMLKTLGATLVTGHFFVILPSIGTPLAIPSIKLSVIGLFTVTRYSFSWLLPARNTLLTRSPLLVKKINP